MKWTKTSKSYAQFKNRLLKERCLVAYANEKGIACICCGEKHIEFLTIDHINGKGGVHRKELGHTYRKSRKGNVKIKSVMGKDYYSWLIKSGFPKGYRILCMNCNTSLGKYGYCPHGNCKIENDVIIEKREDKQICLAFLEVFSERDKKLS